MMMQSTTIIVPRGTFHIRERLNDGGFPLVMLHGWPESSYCWEGIAHFLHPALRIIAPDLRGLGDSERTMEPPLYQKAELAKDIVEIIDTLHPGDFYLAGHDWGGVVAQEVALLLPARVKKLVLMNIPVISNAGGFQEAMEAMQRRGSVPLWYQYFQQQPQLPETMIPGNEEVWIRYFFGKAGKEGRIPEEAIREYIRCYRIEGTPATGAGYYRTMKYDVERWKSLAGVKFHMPTLYIYGNADRVILPEYLNHIEDCFDEIKVVQVNAEHFVQEEEAEVVACLLNNFLIEEGE
jgi:pimeloyl-ACP methyl ester carboxylesterase